MAKPVRSSRLYAAALLAALALAGCAGDGREKREPANAALLEGLMAGAMADCTRRLEAGEFATHVERARCEGMEARGSVEGLGMEYAFGDLAALLSEWRLRLARERDAGTLDAAGERAQQKEFDTAFLREMDVRERLHNDGVRAIEFNFCDIEGNGLRCRQYDRVKAEKENNIIAADCDRRSSLGYFETAEEFTRCVYEDGFVPIQERNGYPHMDLARLLEKYMVDQSRRWAAKIVSTSEFGPNVDAFTEKYKAEVEYRDRSRKAGDLDWRNRKCLIEGNKLACS